MCSSNFINIIYISRSSEQTSLKLYRMFCHFSLCFVRRILNTIIITTFQNVFQLLWLLVIDISAVSNSPSKSYCVRIKSSPERITLGVRVNFLQIFRQLWKSGCSLLVCKKVGTHVLSQKSSDKSHNIPSSWNVNSCYWDLLPQQIRKVTREEKIIRVIIKHVRYQ